MAKDLGDAIGTVVGKVARETAQNMMQNARKSGNNGRMSGMKGVAAGAGLAAAAPLAFKGARLAKRGLGGNGDNPLKKPVEMAGEKLKGAASDVVDKKVSDMGGAGGIAKAGAKSLIPGLGGGDDSEEQGGEKGKRKKGEPGVGKGRRMPVQQSVDIGIPLENVYNHFTQFEEWPKFMHRVTSVNQEDESHVSFKSKIWGVSKEFKAEIKEQRPEERIQWQVTQGLSHKGVVTFHPLAPGLTRIELSVDVEPGSLIEKFARGARHVKRAMRADLHRFKAYVMMNEEPEDDGWRGWIEDGEVSSSEGDEDHSGWQDEEQQEPQGSAEQDEQQEQDEPEAYEDEDEEQDEPQASEDEDEGEADEGDEPVASEDEGEEQEEERPRARAAAARRSGSSRRRSSDGQSGSGRSSSRSRSSNGQSGTKAASSSGGRSRSSSSGSSGGRSRSSSRRSDGGNGNDPSSKSRSSGSSRKKSGSRT